MNSNVFSFLENEEVTSQIRWEFRQNSVEHSFVPNGDWRHILFSFALFLVFLHFYCLKKVSGNLTLLLIFIATDNQMQHISNTVDFFHPFFLLLGNILYIINILLNLSITPQEFDKAVFKHQFFHSTHLFILTETYWFDLVCNKLFYTMLL